MGVRVLAVAALLAAGVVAPEPAPPAARVLATAVPGGRDPAQRYEVTSVVIGVPGRDPHVCVGSIADTRVPLCGGPLVTPWDWSLVEGDEHVRGVSFGEYRLVGTYDGSMLSLTEPPRPARGGGPLVPYARARQACAAPPAGDPALRTERHEARAVRYARRAPEFAGLWATGTVLNVAFTGDLGRHRREIRARWGGRFCVTRFARTYRELRRVEARLRRDGRSSALAGVELTGAETSETRNVVAAGFVIADDVTRRWLAARYGAAVVATHGWLRPVGNAP
jgi:hypothetical protein